LTLAKNEWDRTIMSMMGLSQQQVEERRQLGQGNDVRLPTSRTYTDIIRKNVFNPINIVLYTIGFGMLLVGDRRSAFATVMLVIFNAVVGIVQEVRAKKKLDQIALLARSKVNVVRGGQEQAIEPEELVLGDVLIIRAGDQIPADGRLINQAHIEVDESALTGESDLVPKEMWDEVLSGSFCVTGEALVEATAVGEQSFANDLTKNAREFKVEHTPLQRDVNRILRVLLLIVIFFSLLSVLALFILHLTFGAWLQVMAVITGSVSAGLLTLITLNYSWGAVRVGQKGGLVQQLNAIESLSNVTVLCTDKTGTLTANKILFKQAIPFGIEQKELEQLLGDFAANATATNKTTQAIIDRLPGQKRPLSDEVSFSSARKWSAVALADSGVYVLGALEMLEPHCPIDEVAHQISDSLTEKGQRVLAFAGAPAITQLHNEADEPILPPLTLLGIISFSDELRPELRLTLNAFAANGVKLKVISGDNPQTVAALARQAGMPGDLKAISGPELEAMSPGEFAQVAADTTVFGRVTPQQKEALVVALRNQGEHVAMIGDGVNDVLSLKKANLGIAMESGSTATRSVAAMILLGDSFAAMPSALEEGSRIVNSIQNILKLFMVTVFALLLLIVGIRMLGLGFPFTALQNTLLSFFARGAPPFVLALTASSVRQRSRLSAHILRFTIPASILMFLFGLFIYMGAFFLVGQGLTEVVVSPEMMTGLERTLGVTPGRIAASQFNSIATLLAAQTALTTYFALAGIILMVFAEPPSPWFAGGAPYRGKNRLSAVAALVLIAAYLVILFTPALRMFFQLAPLPPAAYAMIGILTITWVFAQRHIWRSRWLERFLDLDLDDELPQS
jgi:cation-transporting P-type ATPase E